MIKVKVRNRLHTIDGVAGATVQFLDAKGTVVVSGVTDAHGHVTLKANASMSGTLTCLVQAPHTSIEPVGPTLNLGVPIPNRIYRPVSLNVTMLGGQITTAVSTDPRNGSVIASGHSVTVDVQPVWMRSATHSVRGEPISMVVVHHTACNTIIAVNTFLAEKGPHYMIDTDGQIVKWVQDFLAAWHAGEARWAGMNNVNAHSIGIEIVHSAGTFSEAQYNALLDLVGRLTAAFESIDKWNIVGHGDIGTNAGGVLGRKSGDPGLLFQWSRLEARRFGLLMAAGPPAPDIYGGFFQASPSGFLRRGDNDSRHHFGGVTHKDLKTTPVIELQQDLKDVGYSVGTPDGDFGERTHHAVLALQEHFFAGGRSTRKPDGKVDFATAALIKSVAAAGRP